MTDFLATWTNVVHKCGPYIKMFAEFSVELSLLQKIEKSEAVEVWSFALFLHNFEDGMYLSSNAIT